MKSVLKRGLIAGGALVALVAASGGGLRWWLEGKLSKEAIVAQMESSWNCRAQIDSVSLVLLSSPARLEINGCKISPRDTEVAKPLSQRTLLPDGKGEISVARAVLEVKLQDLVSRRLNIQKLVLSDIGVSEDVPKEGMSSLAVLFSKPAANEPAAPAPEVNPASSSVTPSREATVGGSATPAIVPVAVSPEADTAQQSAPSAASTPAPSPLLAKSTDVKPPKEPKAFEASQLGFSILVSNASLERVFFKRVDHKSLTKTDITDLSFSITDIDVSPTDLANHNSFKVALNGRLKQRGRIGPKDARREVTMADVMLTGEGTLHPFEVETGLWKPVSELTLTMKKDSVLGGYMKLGETGSKDLKKLDDYGIDLRDLSLGGPLLEDANIRLTFQNDRNTLQADAHFAMPDFELTLQKDSWLNGAEDEHEMQVRITCGPKLQEQVSNGVKKLLGDELGANVIKTLCDEKGRVYFDMRSSGRLSKPKVVPDVQRLLNRLLQGVGGGLLDGLIKK